MKNTFLLPLVFLLLSGNTRLVFSQEKTEPEQIQTLRGQLAQMKKTSKEEKEQIQREIDFLNLSNQDAQQLFETQNIRIMTNKILIQGVIEGTLMQLKESQDETAAGYSRTRKIVFAALSTLLFLCCCFLVSLILIYRRNKKNFLLLDKMLWQIKNEFDLLMRTQEKDTKELKGELNELRHQLDISDERQHQAMHQTLLRITAIETAAAALKKLSDERTTSLAYFQQQMEDSLENIKQTVKRTANVYEKETLGIEERLAAIETKTDKLKITP